MAVLRNHIRTMERWIRAVKFVKFLEYVELYDSGKLWKDHAYKNYDLLWGACNSRLRRALALCGFRHNEISVSLAECATRVRERGHEALTNDEVKTCLLEWIVWRSIVGGEYRQWTYRKTSK